VSGVGEAGFTLPEVLVAGVLTLSLALPAAALLRTTYRFVDTMQSRFKASEEARQVFALLGEGGAVASASEVAASGTPASSRGFAMAEGVRSLQTLPTCQNTQGQGTLGACLRSSSRFVLPDGSLSLQGDALPAMSISCAGPGVPIPDCAGAETRGVAGWLGSDPAVTYSQQTTASSTVSIGFAVTNPFYATRTRQPATATEQYRTMFTLGAEASW